MQCKLVRELEVAPGAMPQEFVSSHSIVRMRRRNKKTQPVVFWKVGTIFDLPDAYRLVQHGCALPVDDECRAATGMTDEEIAEAQRAYERLSRGIHPDDFSLYDNGVITGYDEQGNYVPGPNFHLLEDAAESEPEVVTSQEPE